MRGGCAEAARGALRRNPLDREHAVDVRTQQAEHPGHAGVRGDAGELCLHAFEQRPFGFGARILQRDPVLGRRLRIDYDHRGARVGEHVLARLVEELERKRDVIAVHEMDLGHIASVRRAVAGAGGDHRGHRALEAVADGVEGEAHERASGPPAPGPGVWLKAALGVNATATTSAGSCPRSRRATSSS